MISNNHIIIDVETDGLEWYRRDRPFLLGLIDGNAEYIIKLPTKGGQHDEYLRGVLDDMSVAKIGHFVNFDAHMLTAAGFKVNGPLIDTAMLAHYSGQRHLGLKKLAVALLGEDEKYDKPLKSWLMKARNKATREESRQPTYKDIPEDILIPYLRKDIRYTQMLYEMWWDELNREIPEIIENEVKLTRVLFEMEELGIHVDRAHFTSRSEKTGGQINDILGQLQERFFPEFNPHSPIHMRRALFDTLDLPVLSRTEKGNPSTDGITLTRYNHPAVDKILQHRRKSKLKSTYYDGILRRVDDEERIHASFKQVGARTGRLSCREPNLQNIPRTDKSVRKGFTPSPNYVLVFIDYSQIEIRLLAHYADEQRMLKILRDGGDIHKDTSSLVFGEVNDRLRQRSKTLNYLMIYGGGAKKFKWTIDRQILEEGEGEPITVEYAREWLDRYFDGHSSVKPFMRSVQDDAKTLGYAEDVFGRKYWADEGYEYRCVNYLIQGTAAQIMKKALVSVDEYLRSLDTGIRIVNSVHDEIILEWPKKDWVENSLIASMRLNEIQDVMEDKTTFRIPIITDTSWSATSWADKQSIDWTVLRT